MEKIGINFGKSTIAVNLDERWKAEIIRKLDMPVIESPEEAVAHALSNPVSSDTLFNEAKGKTTACILICDITRPVPNQLLLPQIVSTLVAGGVKKSDIVILIATGLHRPNEGAELEQLIGDQSILDEVTIINHDAREDKEHIYVGTTSQGVEAKIDKRFVEADIKIVTGLVEPHFMAGYSGGRKVIAPGIAHHKTIRTFHNYKFMSHPRADSCLLEGNPLHEAQIEIVRMLGPILCVNTVLDEKRNLSFVNFGDIESSHLKAVNYAKDYLSIPVNRQYQTIVTSAAGYPLDQTYYQTVKGMVVPYRILAPGGDLIIASECAEGFGSEEYMKSQKLLLSKGSSDFNREIAKKSLAAIDEWQTQMQTKVMNVGNVYLYTTGLDTTERSLTGVQIIDDLNEFISSRVERNYRELGESSLAIIPEGPYVVPAHIENHTILPNG